jgi:RimJ/RimL family protein N-acetyltransferase
LPFPLVERSKEEIARVIKRKVEGLDGVRKRIFVRGEWKDEFLYSILREEWKEPRILPKTN